MTISENKNTHSEICCNTENLALNRGVCFVIVSNKYPFNYEIERESLALLIYNSEISTLKYTIGKAVYELLPNMVKTIWINNEINLRVDNIDKNAQIIILLIPYSEIKIKEFNSAIQEFEIGYRSKLLLNQITDKKKTESIQNFLTKSQLYELLYLQLEAIRIDNNSKLKSHYEKVTLAKSIIDEDITKSHTIPELAKLVGTNEQYLKTYFKQCYHKTISQYTTETKMECAKKLIMNGNHRIVDVARLTGYKHATHFTTAFKKYFGYKPNLLK